MVLSTMKIKCELIWEHIEGSDLYNCRAIGGVGEDVVMIWGWLLEGKHSFPP